MFKREIILCPAIHYDDNIKHKYQPRNIKTGYVIVGYRHINAKYIKQLITTKTYGQNTCCGFITNKNRFVGRKQAWKIYKKTNKHDINYTGDKYQLHSQDLYR